MATDSDQEWDRVSSAGSDVISCSDPDKDHELPTAFVPATRKSSVPSGAPPVDAACDAQNTGVSESLIASDDSSEAAEDFIDCALSEPSDEDQVSTEHFSAADRFYNVNGKTVSAHPQGIFYPWSSVAHRSH